MPQDDHESVMVSGGEEDTEIASQTEPGEYARVIFKDDALPAPIGEIAKLFNAISPKQQRTDAEALFSFLQTNRNPLRLNVGSKLMSALIILPGTSKIDLVYGLGYGTADIGDESPIADKYLCLHGEGSAELGPPDLRIFPNSISEQIEVLSPSDDEVQQALTQKGAEYGAHLIAPRLVSNENKENILRIAPIPSYFVYKAFENSLNAGMIYERLLTCTHESDMITHAKAFLRAAMVGPFRATDNKPFISLADWTPIAPAIAKKWRQDRIKTLFPSIFNQAQPASVEPKLNPTTPSNDLFAAWLRDFKSSFSPPATEMAKSASEPTTGSIFEKTLLKKMCGQNHDADDTVLPTWYGELFQKNQDKKDKDHIIADLLASKSRFEDVKIPIYPELKKMILERNWVGGEAGGAPKLAYACYGITPFAMLDLSEDQIAEMEFTDSYLLAASSIAPTDVKESKSKLVATVPEDSQKWLQVLKRFTNLLFVVFTPSSPLYIKCLDIIKALWAYQTEIISSLSMHAKASIMWILHLQSRHFAQGKMVPDTSGNIVCLPAFSQMYHSICSENIHLVSIAGLPAKLTPTTKPAQVTPEKDLKRKRGKGANNDEEEAEPKRREKEEHPWNPKLKEALAGPLKQAKFPGLAQIKKFCGLAAGDMVIPNGKNDDCRHYFILGSCRFGKACKFTHGTASDNQAATILSKLEKFINEPDGVRG